MAATSCAVLALLSAAVAGSLAADAKTAEQVMPERLLPSQAVVPIGVPAQVPALRRPSLACTGSSTATTVTMVLALDSLAAAGSLIAVVPARLLEVLSAAAAGSEIDGAHAALAVGVSLAAAGSLVEAASTALQVVASAAFTPTSVICAEVE